eukprot:Opistho-2@69711
MQFPDTTHNRSFVSVDPSTAAVVALRMMHVTGADAVAVIEGGTDSTTTAAYADQLRSALTVASSTPMDTLGGHPSSRNESENASQLHETAAPFLGTLRCAEQMSRDEQAMRVAERREKNDTATAVGRREEHGDWLEQQEERLDSEIERTREAHRHEQPTSNADVAERTALGNVAATGECAVSQARNSKKPAQHPQHRFIGTLTASDVRGLRTTMLSQLEQPVIDYLARRHHDHVPQPIAVHPDATLLSVATKALVSRVHRLWVVDESGQPTSVVRIVDILSSVFKDIGGHHLVPAVEE